MGAEAAITAINALFLNKYPREVAKHIETMPPNEASAMLTAQPAHTMVPVWNHLASDVEQAIFTELTDEWAAEILTKQEPVRSAALLTRLEDKDRERYMLLLDKKVAAEITKLMQYSSSSVGHLMDSRVLAFRGELTTQEALERIRRSKKHGLRYVYIVDEENRLDGYVEIQDLAFAGSAVKLAEISREVKNVVQDISPIEDVTDKIKEGVTTDIPVTDYDGHLVGIIRQSKFASTIQKDTTLNMQTMVGASREERALSPALFAVRKRLPWMQINLVTAFLAAAVVGIFEDTIAKYTALAVLLPVVAGQSGNTGAQALAVTMRGLVLREISIRHWPKVVFKEFKVGLTNGLAVAVTTALGVYIWSQSVGLVMIIAASMVISMVIAGMAGALVPIILQRFGQDPAQSSSIVLTTVTDVCGFFSFLGIATLFSSLLVAG